MKPIMTDEQRAQAVTDFFIAQYNRQVKIKNYEALVPYLQEGRIKILCDLQKTGKVAIARSGLFEGYKYFYCGYDAERYFEWLTAVVSGSIQEDLSDDMVKQANDQLFRFINILDIQKMVNNLKLVQPYDWQALLTSFDNRLTEMQKTIIKGENDIAETLSKILVWIKKYSPTLDAIEKERKELFGEGKKR